MRSFVAPHPLTVPRLLCLAGATLLCATLSSPPARAQDHAKKPDPDTLVFKNGDQLTGHLERGVGNSIVFKSDEAGEVTVPFARIKALHSNGNFAVLRKNTPITGNPVVPGPLVFAGEDLNVTFPSGKTETVPVDQIAYIIDQATYRHDLLNRPGFFTGWKGTLNGGATVVRATDYGETFTAGIALVREIPLVPYLPTRNRTSFDLQETYGKLTSPVIPQTNPPTPPAVTETSIFHADAERDQYFSPRFFALAQTAFDHNYAQGLKLQQVYGGGIGWTAVKSPVQEMDLKATIQYERQNFQTAASDQDLIGSTISEAYHRILPRKLVFTESASILPAFNNSNAYSANAAAGLSMPVFKRLALNVATTDNYLNDPSAGYKKNSYQFITGVSYTLK